MIKGKNQHVMPHESGWCVIDEASQQIVRHFDTQDEAIAHAREQARQDEGEVLIHTVNNADKALSTVNLPQREILPEKSSGTSEPSKSSILDEGSDFDPMLGYDEYYFEI